MNKTRLILLINIISILIVLSPAFSEDKPVSPVSGPDGILNEPDRIFDLELPEGFEPDTTEESGILKWSKAGAQIHLVVGRLHMDSTDTLFESLKDAVKKNDNLEKIKMVDLKKGKGLMFRNVAPKDKQRLRFWRLFAVNKKKAFTLECSAVQSEFDKFAAEFEKTLNSFQLKTDD